MILPCSKSFYPVAAKLGSDLAIIIVWKLKSLVANLWSDLALTGSCKKFYGAVKSSKRFYRAVKSSKRFYRAVKGSKQIFSEV